MDKRLSTAALVVLAGNLLAATLPAFPDAYYSGKLADGRALQLLLDGSAKDPAAFVHLEGNPYSITLNLKTNTAQRVEFNCGPYSEAGRWSVTGLTLTRVGLPATASGSLMSGEAPGGVAFTATNIATLEKSSRKRGARVAGRGGGKAFSAMWPAFHDGVPLHESLSKGLAAKAGGDAAGFTAGAYGILWEGLKEGGASWEWKGASEVRLVWLATNLISLCELTYEFTGGAHGNSAWLGRNFVLQGAKAREFKIAELFRPGVNWTNALSGPCLRELRQQQAAWTLPDAPDWAQVKGFTADGLASFNVDSRGLIIHFSDYAVAPHAEGLFSVLIPWKELEPLLQAGSPAGLFLQQRPPR